MSTHKMEVAACKNQGFQANSGMNVYNDLHFLIMVSKFISLGILSISHCFISHFLNKCLILIGQEMPHSNTLFTNMVLAKL